MWAVQLERKYANVASCRPFNEFLFLMDSALTEIYTLSLHDALPICIVLFDTLIQRLSISEVEAVLAHELGHYKLHHIAKRSEEHTSELQSQFQLVCRLPLEKKNNRNNRSFCSTICPINRPRTSPTSC